MRDVHGQWRSEGSLQWSPDDSAKAAAVQQALRAGKLEVEWPHWPDVKVAGVKGRIMSN
jgi:hypothetical protein